MSSFFQWFAVLVIMWAATGCTGEEPALTPPELDPESAGKMAMAAYDKNGDQRLSREELQQSPPLLASLDGLDHDSDGQLSAEEISARVTAYRDSRVALMSLPCKVTLDGKPLDGAEVTLVPEDFMGQAVKPATGITDEVGRCMFRIEGEELPGVNPGFYRIKVSKKDAGGQELVPARYNTGVAIGHDVGAGSASMPELGLTLDLKTP